MAQLPPHPALVSGSGGKDSCLALRAARDDGIRHAIFGDIDLVQHRGWEEKVCAAADLAAWLPLWNEQRRKLVDEFLSLGFKAIVVCVNGRYLGKEFCGREFDLPFPADPPEGVDAWGENGELHTFVHDGPAFAHRVPFSRGDMHVSPTPAGSDTPPYYTLAAS